MNKIEVPECDGWEEVYQSTNLPHAVRQLQDRVSQLVANQNELISRWEAVDEWEQPLKDRIIALSDELDDQRKKLMRFHHTFETRLTAIEKNDLAELNRGMISMEQQLDRHDHWISEHDIGEVVSEIEKPEPGHWECPEHGELQPHEVRKKLCRVRVGDWACQREATWRTDKPSEVLSDSELKELIGGIGASVPAGNPDLCPICGGEISMRKTPRVWVGCIPCNWNWYGESIDQWRLIVTRGS